MIPAVISLRGQAHPVHKLCVWQKRGVGGLGVWKNLRVGWGESWQSSPHSRLQIFVFPRALLLVLFSSHSLTDHRHNLIHSHIWISRKDNAPTKSTCLASLQMLHNTLTCNSRLLLSYSRHFKFNQFELNSSSSPINFPSYILHLSMHSINPEIWKSLSVTVSYLIPYPQPINQVHSFQDNSLKSNLSPLSHYRGLASGPQHLLPGSFQQSWRCPCLEHLPVQWLFNRSMF